MSKFKLISFLYSLNFLPYLYLLFFWSAVFFKIELDFFDDATDLFLVLFFFLCFLTNLILSSILLIKVSKVKIRLINTKYYALILKLMLIQSLLSVMFISSYYII
jgi:hypothetical protein